MVIPQIVGCERRVVVPDRAHGVSSNSSHPDGPGRQPARGYAADMAMIQDPAGTTEIATEITSDADTAEAVGGEIELELVEEISIDGMCGVY
jgi:mycofactocin precursor